MSATSSLRRWAPYVALIVIVVAALAIARGGGTNNSDPAAAQAARVRRITAEIRCPTCRGLTAAESDAEAARAIRTEVARQVAAGRTDGQILDFMVGRYGSDILERPPASGFDGLVWVLPVAALVVAVVSLGFAFRRWRRVTIAAPTAADQARVKRALAGPGPGERE